jgi:hypothetical protein
MANENINETLSAKIRNKLSPYWNLVSLIKMYNESEEKNPEVWKVIVRTAEVGKNDQENLLKLVDKIDQ